jgi:membrane-associated phospholipid phosphatase
MRFFQHITLVVGLFAATTVSGQTQSPYELRTGRELSLFSVGAATGITALVQEKTVDPLTPTTIATLDRSALNAFDRGAAYRYSHTADRLSDVTLAGNVALLGALTLGTSTMRQDVKTIGVMFLETALLANGIQRSVKNIAQRTRPYVYNPDVPLADKLDREARQSFFSGHATNAFAAAVFTGTTFSHYFPTSRYRSVVWVGSLGLASATAVLRYEGGLHYPSDLIAGAAFGSLVGWGIPKLHEVKNRSGIGRRLDIQPFSNGQATGIYARLLVFSR